MATETMQPDAISSPTTTQIHQANKKLDAVEEKSINRLAFWNLFVAFAAFALALPMGAYQVLERSGMFPEISNALLYYTSTSTHGVLMAYVLSTFFIMGFGYHTAAHSLKQGFWSRGFSWFGFGLATLGVVFAAIALLSGNASVMYTFYPPEMAHPIFYIGAALLVIGSWFWCADMVIAVVIWKKRNPGKPVPVIMFGTVMNALLWLWTTLGVGSEVIFQLIPVSLGWADTLDPGLSRTLFSETLHAIVYFWLFPAYLVMYGIMPKEAGGKLFCDSMARVSFVMLFIFSVPIGFHHLYMDPQQAAGWKLLHMFGTFMVAVPSLLTGFTVIASMEIAGRMRGGTKGVFGWVKALDYTNPVVLAGTLALLMLTVGGWGGVVNASYSLDSVVHNTQWIPGHFHLIYGGTTVIMYFAAAYWLWPNVTGHKIFSKKMALWQLWLWFIGMWVTTMPWHYLGIIGQPRRVDTVGAYQQAGELLKTWDFSMFIMNFGAITLLLSGLLFILNLVLSVRRPVTDPSQRKVEYAVPLHPPLRVPYPLNSLSFWNWTMLVYLVGSYGYPVIQFWFIGTPESIPYGY